jgi:hypothetical protein
LKRLFGHVFTSILLVLVNQLVLERLLELLLCKMCFPFAPPLDLDLVVLTGVCIVAQVSWFPHDILPTYKSYLYAWYLLIK